MKINELLRDNEILLPVYFRHMTALKRIDDIKNVKTLQYRVTPFPVYGAHLSECYSSHKSITRLNIQYESKR